MPNVNIKIFAKNDDINTADVIPVFHRWIQKRDLPELLIDVADYSHVPEGPGVLLIAHEANYSLDLAEGKLGLLYNRKAIGPESAEDQIGQSYSAALNACQRLEQEQEFKEKLRFDPGHLEVMFNDRLFHPNTDESWSEIQPSVVRFFDGALGAGKYSLKRVGEPRGRLRAIVHSAVQ
jgi:hypothetical protein